jgi:WD40 repeat protein
VFQKHLVTTIDGGFEFSMSQCDSVDWSNRGRYALASFGGKEEKSNIEKSIIYVWDQRRQEIIYKLGSKASGIVLENYTFVLETHPKDENYFMSGGGAGKVILWDIRTGAQLKVFKEFGHYHRDNIMLDEVFDGKFSSCGNFFAVSTIWGTFSIYSVHPKDPYNTTPVEQFFHLDKHADMESDIYNKTRPYLVNFDRLKYTDQAPLPILGQRYYKKSNTLG